MGHPCGLGHGRIDDHEKLEVLEGLGHFLRVGVRPQRVAGLDDERPDPVLARVEDLLGERVGREVPGSSGSRRRGYGASHPPSPAENPAPLNMLPGKWAPWAVHMLPVMTCSRGSR